MPIYSVFIAGLTVSAESPLIAALVAQKMNAGVCGFKRSEQKKDGAAHACNLPPDRSTRTMPEQ